MHLMNQSNLCQEYSCKKNNTGSCGWRLRFFRLCKQFDVVTISDVLLQNLQFGGVAKDDVITNISIALELRRFLRKL